MSTSWSKRTQTKTKKDLVEKWRNRKRSEALKDQTDPTDLSFDSDKFPYSQNFFNFVSNSATKLQPRLPKNLKSRWTSKIEESLLIIKKRSKI